MGNSKGEYGEGNYKASRDYNERTKQFVESGKVDEAAREAAPKNEAEASQMADAENVGRQRAKAEDPALARRNEGVGDVVERPANETTTPKPGQEGH